MPSGQASQQAFSSSTTGDGTLLDARSGCITARHRTWPCTKQYRPATTAGCRGGGCRRLPVLRLTARRLAYEPCRIRTDDDPALLAANRRIRFAAARPDLGDREPGPLLDHAHHHPARLSPRANRPFPVPATPELPVGGRRNCGAPPRLWRCRDCSDLLRAQLAADRPTHSDRGACSRAAPGGVKRDAKTPIMTLLLAPKGTIKVKGWVGFPAMSIGMFMAILDIQIVASSLPEIQAGLGIALNQLSWVQTAYLIAEVVAIPLTGWLTRIMSTRGAFLTCICGFTAASLACAASNSFWSLIPARVLQGFCGGALIPLVFSAGFLMFQGLGRTPATLVAGLLATLAPTLGPAVGGFITDRYSWHWLFLINVPSGIVVALLVAWAVDIDRPDWRCFRSVDLLALPLLAIFLGSLQLVLKEAPHRGWGSSEVLLLAGICFFCAGGVIW